jgi:hypothetical protein
MKMAAFCVVAPCSLVEVHRRFRGPCCFHLLRPETLFKFYLTTRRYNPEETNLRFPGPLRDDYHMRQQISDLE